MSIIFENGQYVNVVKETITRQHIVDNLNNAQTQLDEARAKVAKLETHIGEVNQDLAEYDALEAAATPQVPAAPVVSDPVIQAPVVEAPVLPEIPPTPPIQ